MKIKIISFLYNHNILNLKRKCWAQLVAWCYGSKGKIYNCDKDCTYCGANYKDTP